MLTTGQFIGDGRYEILEKIGSGGMADVYKAKCHKLNRNVAIKVLKEEFIHNREFVNKFKAEAQAAACLSHQNIVGIYDVVEEGNLYYIVMEYIDGITLKQYIAEHGHLSEEEALIIALQIAQGLSAAHDQHIVHRDIKPQNILLGKDGVIKVADFGIARAVTGSTISATAIGSVHYFSPEQARGSLCDERSDIYSLGISLFEMLTGTLPFTGDTSVAVALSHINDSLPSIDQYVSGVSEETKEIVRVCTMKKPEQRYLTVYDLIAELKKALAVFAAPVGAVTGAEEDTANGYDALLQEPDGDITEEQSVDLAADMEEEEEIETTVLDKVILGFGIGILVLILGCAVYLAGSTGLFDRFRGEESDGISFSESQEDWANEDTSNNSAETAEEDTTGEEKVKMPDVLGKSLEEAAQILKEAGLKYEMSGKLSEYSEKYEAGLICQQEYKAGKKIPEGTRVKLGISLGSERFEVKSEFVGMQKQVLEMRLANRNIKVNYIEQSDESTAAGQILRLEPSSGYLDEGDTLTVYVSTGPTTFALPKLAGMTEAQARAAIKDAGMEVGSVTESYSSSVKEGFVISQSPSSGTKVAKGTSVSFVISKGPESITMPNLLGKDYEEAKEILEEAGLAVGNVTKDYSSTYDKDEVMKQSVKADKKVDAGTKIDLVISQGSEKAGDTEVLLGMKEADAKSKLSSLGLKYDSTVKESSSSVAAGCVIRVEKAGGSGTIYKGDSVILVVSSGVEQNKIPNVIGKSQSDAKSALEGKNFVVVIKEVDGTEAAGTVVSQSPSADTMADRGSTVTISVSKGNQVAVPALADKTYEAARAEISNAGLSEDIHSYVYDSRPAGTVISQSVTAGSIVAKGTKIKLTISQGPEPTQPETPPESVAEGAE